MESSLGKAVKFLAGICDGAHLQDGQGFNKLDTEFGHKLASIPEEQWTPKQRFAAWRMLEKYQKQLLTIGIDYDSIPKPEIPTLVPEAKPQYVGKIVPAIGNDLMVTFRYAPSLVAGIKSVGGARWNPDVRAWFISVSASSAEKLRAWANTSDIEFTAEALAFVEKQTATEMQRLQESIAKSAEIQIDGLGGELYPFQRASVRYALNARRCFLAEQMGLGKSPEALAVCQAAKAFPALIICPASLKLNWQRETQKWLPGKSVAVLSGRGSNTTLPQADVVIINYDIVKAWKDVLAQRKWQALICDESQALKDSKSLRGKTVKELAKGIEYVLLLSGTAVLNRPAELINQLEVLGRFKEIFGGWFPFVKRYCSAQQTPWGWQIGGASNTDELNVKLRANCYVRHMKSDVLTELPNKLMPVELPVDITNRAEYARAARDVIDWLRTEYGNPERAAAAQQTQVLVQIGVLRRLAAKGKLPSVVEWMESFLESDEKLVVFAHHIEIQDALLAAFPNAARIRGDENVDERQKNVDRFQQDQKCRLIICSLQAGGVGVTLTAASNVAFVEFPWTPSALEQATDRLHRIGQKNAVRPWYFIAENTIDVDMLDLLAKKEDVVTAVIDGKSGATSGVLKNLIDRLLKKDLTD